MVPVLEGLHCRQQKFNGQNIWKETISISPGTVPSHFLVIIILMQKDIRYKKHDQVK